MSTSVRVRRETVHLPTYEPQRPDPNPMFLEKRVYQGSTGKVYPLPCTDRIASEPTSRAWDAIYLENEYVLVMLLPQMGGRIHRLLDKSNNYDAIYHQTAIKPALVGLTGPWCSGGIEFNWPQHHRPSTFLPTDVAIERAPDGSATVWMSEHDPMARMKGMHGVRLRPGSSLVELRVRAYNRTPDVQTFLWWANVATRVHEAYQSFFPADVEYVADHAKRAMTTFPHSNGKYYGVDYAKRAKEGVPDSERPAKYQPPSLAGIRQTNIPPYQPDNLSWYANIPVPTSYMCMGSSEDFSGGYDFKAAAGLIHVANHHISPGKKQWTWGNHEFGYAWDRNLTDPDENGEYRPYIELMAGVYTDNQPDFSFLQPGETKTWSQYWYPFREIGPAAHANLKAAVSLNYQNRTLRIGVSVTEAHSSATVQLLKDGKVTERWKAALAPDRPCVLECSAKSSNLAGLSVLVATGDGTVLIEYAPKPVEKKKVPDAAQEPPIASKVTSSDELFQIGLHLEQYRHATRRPEVYWQEALRRDPLDTRCNLALGRWHLRRGEFPAAQKHLRQSIARSISRNPNPYDGEPYYQLGLCLQYQFFARIRQDTERTVATDELLVGAYSAFYKATWNHAWQAAGFHALAEIDCLRQDWLSALDHLERALRLNADNLRARNLKVIVLRQLGRGKDAEYTLAETLRIDPLDWWALYLSEKPLDCDNQVRIDLALDCARAGLFSEGLSLLAEPAISNPDCPDGSLGTEPMVCYTRAWLTHLQGLHSPRKNVAAAVANHLRKARRADPAYCFPSRLEEIAILEFAIDTDPEDSSAGFHLGNLLYDRRRHAEAIKHWERTVQLSPKHAMAWRNLGIAYHNVRGEPTRARIAYERALAADPHNARYVYERDQLWKRLRVSPRKRLSTLREFPKLIPLRDDLSVEYCNLCNQTGEYESALEILSTRRFQPWEGGEGLSLAQHVRTHLGLGRRQLAAKNFTAAIASFETALAAPVNLGEARHLLANSSDILFWLGCALDAAGRRDEAVAQWRRAANFRGDFQGMSVRSYSEMTYFSALALQRLGRQKEANRLARGLLNYARKLAKTPATIDYFATSLPTMLLFDDDLQERQDTSAQLLEGQALLALGQRQAGQKRLRAVLKRDPSHSLAADLLAL